MRSLHEYNIKLDLKETTVKVLTKFSWLCSANSSWLL